MNSQFDKRVDELQKNIIKQIQGRYSGVVINHWMQPRNLGVIENPDGHARITGPCGDTIEITICSNNNRIIDATDLHL